MKYRHKIISEEIQNRLIEILNKIADDNKFHILECNTDKDHIHLLMNCSPQHYIPDMIKALKGVYCDKYIKLPKLGKVKTKNRFIPQGRILQQYRRNQVENIICHDTRVPRSRKPMQASLHRIS